ncbi:unnamed protein product [Closterium sp. NIES-64]|nr:unnamed protein product [Closterium sp. NIES-64]
MPPRPCKWWAELATFVSSLHLPVLLLPPLFLLPLLFLLLTYCISPPPLLTTFAPLSPRHLLLLPLSLPFSRLSSRLSSLSPPLPSPTYCFPSTSYLSPTVPSALCPHFCTSSRMLHPLPTPFSPPPCPPSHLPLTFPPPPLPPPLWQYTPRHVSFHPSRASCIPPTIAIAPILPMPQTIAMGFIKPKPPTTPYHRASHHHACQAPHSLLLRCLTLLFPPHAMLSHAPG